MDVRLYDTPRPSDDTVDLLVLRHFVCVTNNECVLLHLYTYVYNRQVSWRHRKGLGIE